MIIDDKKPRSERRAPDGFSEEPPPGFIITEGRSFILVGADHVGRFVKRSLAALRALSRSAARRS